MANDTTYTVYGSVTILLQKRKNYCNQSLNKRAQSQPSIKNDSRSFRILIADNI